MGVPIPPLPPSLRDRLREPAPDPIRPSTGKAAFIAFLVTLAIVLLTVLL